VVAGIGSLTLVGALARRLGGPRRVRLGFGAHGVVTDPGSRQAVEQLTGEIDALRDEIAGLRREMDEAQNRIDFTERLLAQARTQGKLSPGSGAP
jgi:hypothetical protein